MQHSFLLPFLCIEIILPVLKELGKTPLIKHLLNSNSKTGAMADADILTIFKGISSGPAHLATFNCWMWVKISAMITGLKKKKLDLFAVERFVKMV